MAHELNVNNDEMFGYDIENNCNVINEPSNNKNNNEMSDSLIQPKSILYNKGKEPDDVTIAIIK